MKWFVLVAGIICAALLFLDQTMMKVALPTIGKEFSASPLELHLIIDVYLLSLAVFMLGGGKLADIFGHKRIFALGMLVFGIASIICSLSSNVTYLIFGRVIQGIGGALMLPPSLPLAFEMFSKEKRGQVLGIQVSVGSIFLVLGPLIGGFFTEYLSWRWAFAINVPLTILGAAFALAFGPKKEKILKEKFDFFGFLTFAGAVVFLNITLMHAGREGLTPTSLCLILLSFAMFLLFYYLEKKGKQTFIDFSFFSNSGFIRSNVAIFTAAFVLMLSVFWAIYMQVVLELSPFQAGFYSMLPSFPILFMPLIAGTFYDKFGARMPIIIGLSLLLFSFALVAIFMWHHNFFLLLGSFLFTVAGSTTMLTPAYSAAISSAPLIKGGMANGLTNTIRQIGASFGVAVLGTLITKIQGSLEGAGLQVKDLIQQTYKIGFFYADLLCLLIVLVSLLAFIFVFKKVK